jgi:plasmid rolling circle replication initiator protein Rep
MSEIPASDSATPSLSDLSHRDKPWDKHKSNSDKVASHFMSSEQFQDYGQRVNSCSDLLDFCLVNPLTAAAKDSLVLKLSSARFCRVRLCPVCQWRRSLMWKAKAHQLLPGVLEKYPTHRWLFLTLTVKNCQIEDLRTTLTSMHDSFKRMTKLKSFPSDGWIKSTEVTRGDDNSAHPHFHCLLMVPAGYFARGYLSTADWASLWQKSLRIDYTPITHVRAIKKEMSPITVIPELMKYCTKESDLVAHREWFLELARQMHNARTIAVGGVLKSHLKELENEPQDLIGKDDDQVETDDKHLLFGWQRKDKKYKLIN